MAINKKKTNNTKVKKNVKTSNKPVKTKPTRKRKISAKKIRNIILILFLTGAILAVSCVLAFAIYIMVTSPEFEVTKLYTSSSSIIYDSEMNEIATIGAENRQNVTFDELPDVLVDAIIATEDSKFFQHNGIDLLRFSKAVLGQILGQSDAGGGSTLTMQVVKNTYNGTEAHGIDGIIRKFKDIYMSVFKVEKTYTKQEIIEFYVNQPYLGGYSYGVEQASETYFGKSVSELNLTEAATIAGLFQAPGAYDPTISPQKAEARRNLVLSLMVRHGYITKEERDVAAAIPMSELLHKKEEKTFEYQGFIDTIIADVQKKTGNSPFSVSMKIYSTMDKSKQDVVNDLYAGKIYTWRNDVVQCGIGVIDVNSGAVVAVGAGRNKKGILTYNYATTIKRQPGSTAKAILDYGPAIEYAGYGTGSFVMDDTYHYSDGSKILNVDLSYFGPITIKRALANSRNIPALQIFQATTQEQKLNFASSLGIDVPLYKNEALLESYSVGAFDGVSPVQLSAAYATFARGGYYIEPYTFTKIDYNDTGETYIYNPTKKKAISEETAYLINNILMYAVTSGAVSGVPSISGTTLASKTGTTSLDNSKRIANGLSSNAIGDVWQVVYSPDYAVATWYGYDAPYSKKAYLTSPEGWDARKKITNALASRIMKKNSKWTMPSGITTVEIELETNPVQLASDGTPSNLRSTEYYKSGTEPTETSTRFATLSNVSHLTYTSIGNQALLSWKAIETPEAISTSYLEEYFEKGYGQWAQKYLNKRLTYNEQNIGTVVYEVYIKNADGSLTKLGSTPNTNYTVTIPNGGSATYVVKSSYSIYKQCTSSGTPISIKISVVTPPNEEVTEEEISE